MRKRTLAAGWNPLVGIIGCFGRRNGISENVGSIKVIFTCDSYESK
jgi:hypothetical protein